MAEDTEQLLRELKDILGKDRTPAERQKDLKVKAEALVLEKKNIVEVRKSSKAYKELIKKLGGSKKELQEWDSTIDNSIKAHKSYEKSIRDVGSTLMGFGRAAAAGEGSISAFTDNLKGFNAITDSIVNLGNRLDTNIETFRGLAETGASFGQSIVGLRRAAATAALPLDDFAALVRDNSVNLAALFGSTTEGAKRVAQLAAGFRRTNIDALAPLGFTIDEINETLLQNLERQRRTFNFEGKADESNMASALAYAQQLDRLAKLTGVQRKELQAQIESQMSNERFQAMLAGQTRETGQRLETFAATIGSISPELAEGFQDLIANAGVPVTEAALALVQNLPEARFAVQNLISGVTTAEDALVSVRDASVRSQDRFRQATVTGQVEFLRLQGGIIKLGSTALDVNSVLAEQAAVAPRVTQGLTTFQNATKILASQFQRIETELLAGFGPALGGFTQATQGLMGGVGKMIGMIAQIPALTAPLILGGIVGKYLFDKASQIAIVTAGVRLGTMHMAGAGGGPGMLGGLGKTAGKVGKFGLTRALPAVGAAMGVGSSLAMLGSKDEQTQKQGKFGLGGAAAGALAGFMMGGPVGALIGAGLGSMGGQALGSSRQTGTLNTTGKAFEPATANMLVHKNERVLNTDEAKTVNQLEQGINFKPLLDSMTALNTKILTANNTLTSMSNSVNTLVGINNEGNKIAKRTMSDTSARGVLI